MPVGRHLIETHRTLVINDAFNYDAGTPEMNVQIRKLARQNGGLSKIVCPLVVQGQFRGALCIHQTDRLRRWTRGEVALVESVAAQLATGIAQAELFEMVERAKRTWETTFDAMSDGIFIFSNERRLMRVNRAGAGLEVGRAARASRPTLLRHPALGARRGLHRRARFGRSAAPSPSSTRPSGWAARCS